MATADSDVSSKFFAWLLAGVGSLLAYSLYAKKLPLDILQGISSGRSIGSGDASSVSGSGADPVSGLSRGTGNESEPVRLRMIANREMAPTLVPIQPYGQLDKAAAASKARIDAKLGYPVPASSANDAYRPYSVQAAGYASGDTIGGKPRYASPEKGLHVVGLAFDIHADYNKPEVYEAFRQEGWHQTRPVDEPWHWSYGVRG